MRVRSPFYPHIRGPHPFHMRRPTNSLCAHSLHVFNRFSSTRNSDRFVRLESRISRYSEIFSVVLFPQTSSFSRGEYMVLFQGTVHLGVKFTTSVCLSESTVTGLGSLLSERPLDLDSEAGRFGHSHIILWPRKRTVQRIDNRAAVLFC